jgi:septum formation protein
MKQVILASGSPRRKDLLTRMGVKFTVVPSNVDEPLDNNRTPEEVAIELALAKARSVAEQHPDALVVGSDTIVAVDDKQLAKPADETEARQMLQSLAGRHNVVVTSIVTVCKAQGCERAAADATLVYFKPFDEQAMQAYLSSGDWHDKAGAYGVQSGAAPLIDHLSGDYDTVVGLPTKILAHFLQEEGIDAQPVIEIPPVPQK